MLSAAVAEPLVLGIAGIVAGFVDSIAGGGGLITLPALSLAVGQGVDAIGTNKICGLAAAAVALLVYMRRGHVQWRNSAAFAVATATGGLAGSRLAPLLPQAVFPWLLAITCPIILYVVWKKDLWVAREAPAPGSPAPSIVAIVGSGMLVGIYDGAWGPGSGTFMFLALLFVVRLPLLTSLAGAKLANGASAAIGLVSYAASGHVHPREGIAMALGTLAGGFTGAHLASARAARIVRPVLVVVVGMLVLKLVTDALRA